MKPLFSLWGGLECTINRVQSTYYDQFQLAGHYDNNKLMHEFNDLEFSAFRFPVLWEKYGSAGSSSPEWQFADNQLELLRQKKINPVIGLVHHGSGPVNSSIETLQFSTGLASYARRVAERYPWVEQYTPVNEPLTTARFCGLYGLWYPHGQTDRSFVRILLNECLATVLSMKAIREINPLARLVQTEDLCKIYSTPEMGYQADFENERRFLSLDLLCGMVTDRHPLWNYLLNSGATMTELEFFQLNPCKPDILGFNYYITSERFLDHRIALYPRHTHGRNSRQLYADVEAVRVDTEVPTGPYIVLKEAWERYGLPMAITEVHLNSSHNDQLRWYQYVAEAATSLILEGVDIRALTLWALTGAYGWDKLLVNADTGTYEAGLLKITNGRLVSTPYKELLVSHMRNETARLDFTHGWWEKESRIEYARR